MSVPSSNGLMMIEAAPYSAELPGNLDSFQQIQNATAQEAVNVPETKSSATALLKHKSVDKRNDGEDDVLAGKNHPKTSTIIERQTQDLLQQGAEILSLPTHNPNNLSYSTQNSNNHVQPSQSSATHTLNNLSTTNSHIHVQNQPNSWGPIHQTTATTSQPPDGNFHHTNPAKTLPTSAKSYATALVGASTVVGLVSSSCVSPLIPLSTYKGEPALVLPDEAVTDSLVGFKYALVGKFPIFPKVIRPSMERVRMFFARLNLKSAYEVGSLDLGHILIRLTCAEDYQRLWARETWDIDRIQMRVFKWSMDFANHKESPIVPAWILLPGLPPNFFKRNILFSIVQAVGKPLKMDHATETLARPSVARVCVEVDLMTPNPSRIWVAYGNRESGFWQKIEYEYLPKYCIGCFRLGHENSECQGRMMPPTTLQHSYKQPQQFQIRDEQRQKKNTDTSIKVTFGNHGMIVSQNKNKNDRVLENGGAKTMMSTEVWIPRNKGVLNKETNPKPNQSPVGNPNEIRISNVGGSRNDVELANSFALLQHVGNPDIEEEDVTTLDKSDIAAEPDLELINSIVEAAMINEIEKCASAVLENQELPININVIAGYADQQSEDVVTDGEENIEESPIVVNGKEVVPWTGIECDEIDKLQSDKASLIKSRGLRILTSRPNLKIGRMPVRTISNVDKNAKEVLGDDESRNYKPNASDDN